MNTYLNQAPATSCLPSVYATIIEQLRADGHTVTRQRACIMRAICALGDIDDVEKLWMELRRQHDISLATVYSTVRLLSRYGILLNRNNGQRKMHYSLREKVPSCNGTEQISKTTYMLSTQIKEVTKGVHQEMEKKVVSRIKAIETSADYAALLKCFYAYFKAVEQHIAPFIHTALPDYEARRNSSHIKADIETMGSNIDVLPQAIVPEITDALQAMGALYVLEGSIMGGPYIVQMLQKKGVQQGFSFFNGYGAASGTMWGTFTAALNALPQTQEDKDRAMEAATQTFRRFGEVFDYAEQRSEG